MEISSGIGAGNGVSETSWVFSRGFRTIHTAMHTKSQNDSYTNYGREKKPLREIAEGHPKILNLRKGRTPI
jgi:hypothetical protein